MAVEYFPSKHEDSSSVSSKLTTKTKMYLRASSILSLGYVLQFWIVSVKSGGGGGKEKVHIKIVVPELIKHHHHTKYVYIHPKKHHGHHGHKEKKKPLVVIHKHEHSHKLKHDHGHKHGHQHGHKHKGKQEHKHEHKVSHKHIHEVKKVEDKHHDKHHDHWSLGGDTDHHTPYNYYDAGYGKGHKSTKTKHFEVSEVKNSDPLSPVNQYVVKGSYKVQEPNPYDHTTQSYYEFNYPPLTEGNTNYKKSQIETKYVKNHKVTEENYDTENEDKAGDDVEQFSDDGDDSEDYSIPSNYLQQEKDFDEYIKNEYGHKK